MDFRFEPVIAEKAPDYRLIAVEADVKSEETPDALWQEITAFAESYRACHEMSEHARPTNRWGKSRTATDRRRRHYAVVS